jgi:hypothetical protein
MFYRLLNRKTYDNTESSYKQLSAKTARAREAGTLPINCFYDEYSIVDVDDEEYVSPEEAIDEIIDSLKYLPSSFEDGGGLPRWYNQPEYVEIWIEKMQWSLNLKI